MQARLPSLLRLLALAQSGQSGSAAAIGGNIRPPGSQPAPAPRTPGSPPAACPAPCWTGCSGRHPADRHGDLGHRMPGRRRSWPGVPGAERKAQCRSELAAARVPVGGRFGHSPGQHLVDRRRQVGPQGSGQRRRLGEVRVHNRDALLAPEWRLPAKHLERRAGQRVLIRPAVELPSLDLLRSDVVKGAEELSGRG